MAIQAYHDACLDKPELLMKWLARNSHDMELLSTIKRRKFEYLNIHKEVETDCQWHNRKQGMDLTQGASKRCIR